MRKSVDVRKCVCAGLESQKGDDNLESACRIERLGKADHSPSESSGQDQGNSRARYAFTDRTIFGGD